MSAAVLLRCCVCAVLLRRGVAPAVRGWLDHRRAHWLLLSTFRLCGPRPLASPYPLLPALSLAHSQLRHHPNTLSPRRTHFPARHRTCRYGVRVNTISAGPLGSRAAKAIGFIDDMIR